LIWSSEQILSLAPDAPTARRGQDLGTIRKWRNLEGNENALWGECKSSGVNFYKTQIDLKGPAFKCNCPSRKFPCKHAIGLLFLYVSNSEAFRITGKMPPELSEWLENRKNKSSTPDSKPNNENVEKAKAAAAKKRQKRLERMASGFEDLEIWLGDLIRQGLATTEGQAYSFWQDFSARMVDAQIGGVGRKIKSIPLLHGSNTKWPERMLAEFAQMYLLAKGFKNLEKLPDQLQTELLSIAGINIRKDDLLLLKGIIDEWKVVGIIEGIDDNLNFRRTWIYGKKSRKTTLILDFSFGDAGYETQWATGQCFQAEIVYYPSSFPLRAMVKKQFGNVDFIGQLIGFKTLEAFFIKYAQAIAANPWMLDFPCLLEGVTPFINNGELTLIDKKKKKIPVLNKGNKGWKMLALSGGHPITVFGEWSGELFVPLSVVSEDRVIAL
jgi:hypothetical protein